MTDNWEQVYIQAALEVDKAKMPERLSAARRAIQGRLQDFVQTSDHDERKRIKIALKNLNALEIESQTWS